MKDTTLLTAHEFCATYKAPELSLSAFLASVKREQQRDKKAHSKDLRTVLEWKEKFEKYLKQ